MASLTKSDLQFILAQINIAEAHAAGTPLPTLIPNVFASLGLRTVDGSLNNLLPGQSGLGASDHNFPLLLPQNFGNEMDEAPFGPITNTNYAASAAHPVAGGGGTGASVVDSDPRTISNLIVDQTVGNRVAYEVAFDPGVNALGRAPGSRSFRRT